ncbi:unnamed protein product [Vitrella brassicaformis CCMP3155]|uniref:Uncharacterized protein n=3 Tax=Vitrella brassicaformis TaxID=1169539 RepID=A0A0G4FNM5_VITBC|nr:unnamed protein product [Vitrella brassicaformis CCMP3155]|eukprot:CEM15821.1 unnamed protein product [Vitrella brassicaformis CCMP3155]
MAVPLRDIVNEDSPVIPLGLLYLAIDCSWSPWNFGDGRELALPKWPCRKLHAAVLGALVSAEVGTDRRCTVFDTPPILTAVRCADSISVEVLLKNGAATHGLCLAFPVLSVPATQPSRQYETDQLEVYHQLLEHDPSLAVEEDSKGNTPIHVAAALSTRLSSDFVCSYLDLLMKHGASPSARSSGGKTPLDLAMVKGQLHVAEWLCKNVGAAEINKKPNLLGLRPLMEAGLRLSHRLRDKAPPEQIDTCKQVIRTLLEHGADTQLMHKTTPGERYACKLVQDIQQDMQGSTGTTPQQQEDDAVAARIAEELIADEKREKAKKKGKMGGKKGTRQQWPLPSTEADSSVASGAIDRDTNDQPSSSLSSADLHPGPSAPPTDAAGVVSPPPVDGESDGDESFVPVVSRRKRDRQHKQQMEALPESEKRMPLPSLPPRPAYPPPPRPPRVREDRVRGQTDRSSGDCQPLPPPPPFPLAPQPNDAASALTAPGSRHGERQVQRPDASARAVRSVSASEAEGMMDQLRQRLEEAKEETRRKEEREDELKRQLEEAQKKLAELTMQQAASSSSAATQPSTAQQRECVTCLSAPPVVMFVPCRHLCLCQPCYTKWQAHFAQQLQQAKDRQAAGSREELPKFRCAYCGHEGTHADTLPNLRRWINEPFLPETDGG